MAINVESAIYHWFSCYQCFLGWSRNIGAGQIVTGVYIIHCFLECAGRQPGANHVLHNWQCAMGLFFKSDVCLNICFNLALVEVMPTPRLSDNGTQPLRMTVSLESFRLGKAYTMSALPWVFSPYSSRMGHLWCLQYSWIACDRAETNTSLRDTPALSFIAFTNEWGKESNTTAIISPLFSLNLFPTTSFANAVRWWTWLEWPCWRAISVLL